MKLQHKNNKKQKVFFQYFKLSHNKNLKSIYKNISLLK